MRPYIAAWKESSHKDIDCMKCHAHEGLSGYFETKFTALSMLANYATGIYKRSRPWAEIEDRNCLQEGCHQTRLLDGRIEFTKEVVFDHTPHLTETRRGRKLRCTSCHSQIVQGEHISVTTSTCFLCHFKNVYKEGRAELAECLKCHTPPVGQVSDELGVFDHSEVLSERLDCQSCHKKMWQGSGGVRRERCGTCHSSVEHIDRINDLEFVHEWHIEKRKVECQRCHDPIEHHQPSLDLDFRRNCEGCHSDQHSAKSFVYQGIGSRLIESPMPDTMFVSGVVCASCHKESGKGRTLAEMREDACVPCHKKIYNRLVTEWRKGFRQRIQRLEEVMSHASAHPKLEEARHDLELLKSGGAWHNTLFADTLLSRIASVLTQAGADPHLNGDMPPASKPCLVCHSSIAEMPVKVHWSEFNHGTHRAERGLDCRQCHTGGDPDNPDHGRRIKTKTTCNQCHHDVKANEQDLCLPCHSPQRNLFQGELPGEAKEPSPMASAGMICIDCHQSPGFAPPPESFCLDCHDQSVVDDLELWKKEFKNALKKDRKRVGDAVKLITFDGGRAVHNPDLARKILFKKQ